MGVRSSQDTVAAGLGVGHGRSAYPDPVRATQPYQGLWREHACSRTPREATKKCPLTAEQKRENRALSRRRLPVEQVIRCLKIFWCLASVYRHRRRRFHLRLNLLAGIYNAMLTA